MARRRRVRPRPGPHRAATAGSATSGPTWSAASSASCCRSSVVAARRPRRSSASCRTSPPPRLMTTLTGGTQELTGGPVASQEAIKELGTNGGGFYNVNSAHPFENPTPFTNLFEIFLLLLIPFAMAWAFGLIVRDRRQGVAVLAVMALLLGVSIALLTWAEMAGPGTAPGARRRRDGGQGGPLRHGGLGPVRRRHHRHLDRRGELHARLVHRSRRRRRDVQHDARRDRARRRRLRPLRHADARRRHGVPRPA